MGSAPFTRIARRFRQKAKTVFPRVRVTRQRWGEPSAEQMADLIALTKKPQRPYCKRFAGIRRQIARNNGLHPIRDRAVIEALMPRVLMQAKQVKRQVPRVKYRNIEIANTGVRGVWTSAGPTM